MAGQDRFFGRRQFLTQTAGAGAAVAGSSLALPTISFASSRPVITHGVQSGDVALNSAVIWARTNKPSRMLVDISTRSDFKQAVSLQPVFAHPGRDFAVKRLLTELPAGQEIFYRVRFSDLDLRGAVSEPVIGHFRTPSAGRRPLRFVWSGDTAGQGWGIGEGEGGAMLTYRTMAAHNPDFFIHSGDTVYADGPIAPTREMPGGGVWKNKVAEGVEKVAETVDEFRGRWKYNLLDAHVAAFNGQVPAFYQWDDHEVVNNWSAAKDLASDDRYTEKSVPLLTQRATQAFHEMNPIRHTPEEPGRVYRQLSYGPLLDVFFIDLRSYRGPNSASMQPNMTPESRIVGETQLQWLKRGLLNSRATWKVIASDMPLGLIVWDHWKEKSGAEAIANGNDGKPLGRELEFAELLRFIKVAGVRNMVWLTADVHYTAAHYYNPDKAAFQDFDPFWEFVSGPLHAGSFGPNGLDMTFGPEVRFAKAPTSEQGVNLPPSMGLQFFGQVDIDDNTEVMTVSLFDRADKLLFEQKIEPVLRG